MREAVLSTKFFVPILGLYTYILRIYLNSNIVKADVCTFNALTMAPSENLKRVWLHPSVPRAIPTAYNAMGVPLYQVPI